MTGLVERLAAYANCEAPPIDDVLREAAARIATLEGEVERLRGLADEHALFDAETDSAFKNLDLQIADLTARAQTAEARLAEAAGLLRKVQTEMLPDAMILAGHPDPARWEKHRDLLNAGLAELRAFLKSHGDG